MRSRLTLTTEMKRDEMSRPFRWCVQPECIRCRWEMWGGEGRCLPGLARVNHLCVWMHTLPLHNQVEKPHPLTYVGGWDPVLYVRSTHLLPTELQSARHATCIADQSICSSAVPPVLVHLHPTHDLDIVTTQLSPSPFHNSALPRDDLCDQRRSLPPPFVH